MRSPGQIRLQTAEMVEAMAGDIKAFDRHIGGFDHAISLLRQDPIEHHSAFTALIEQWQTYADVLVAKAEGRTYE